jgi:hypothetical protein
VTPVEANTIYVVEEEERFNDPIVVVVLAAFLCTPTQELKKAFKKYKTLD